MDVIQPYWMSNIIPCIIMIKTVNIILNSWLINIEMTNRTKFHLILTSCLSLALLYQYALAINVTMALNFAEGCCCIKLPGLGGPFFKLYFAHLLFWRCHFADFYGMFLFVCNSQEPSGIFFFFPSQLAFCKKAVEGLAARTFWIVQWSRVEWRVLRIKWSGKVYFPTHVHVLFIINAVIRGVHDNVHTCVILIL